MHELVEYHPNAGEPEIKKYIPVAGTIRPVSYNNNSYYISDIEDFLQQIEEYGGPFARQLHFDNVATSENVYAPRLYLELPYGGRVNFGNLTNSFFQASTSSNNRPIYWLIYRSKDGDIGVSIAKCTGSHGDSNTTINGDGSINNKHSINDRITYMSERNPWLFEIVGCINSLTNESSGESGIILPPATQVTWTDTDANELGKILSGMILPVNFGRFYYSERDADYPQENLRFIRNSVLMTSDTPYFPRFISNESAVKNGCFSDISGINYLLPMWSPSTPCIAKSAKCLMWGGNLELIDQEGIPYPKVNIGPYLDSVGDKTYIRCGDIYLPVERSVDPEPED